VGAKIVTVLDFTKYIFYIIENKIKNLDEFTGVSEGKVN